MGLSPWAGGVANTKPGEVAVVGESKYEVDGDDDNEDVDEDDDA
jgi:hypothetical protein